MNRMDEYIKKQTAYWTISALLSKDKNQHKILRACLERIPVEDVKKVVRCKDCVHLGTEYCPRFSPPDNGYCDLGRKDG